MKSRTLKGPGNENAEFELAGSSSYRGKFLRSFDQGKGNLVLVRGFELSEVLLYYSIIRARIA